MAPITPALLDPFIECCVGRYTDYTLQQADGRYLRTDQPLTYPTVLAHLEGRITIGTYLLDEQGYTRSAVLDSDIPSGLADLAAVQHTLAGAGVVSYLELTRRGAHLRVFVAEPTPAFQVRAWLLPYCPAGVEFYPKQDRLSAECPYGSVMRLPLGVHRLTGLRYPFVELRQGEIIPLMTSVVDALSWFACVQRMTVPALAPVPGPCNGSNSTQQGIPFKNAATSTDARQWSGIRDWCAAHDPFEVIGRYVALDEKGMGCCPFGSHHDDGVDTHPSFWVYRPRYPDLYCWYCHTWQAGGSLFDFLRYYYALDARELWSRILSGAHF